MKNFAITVFSAACLSSLIACSSGSDSSTTVAGGGRGGIEYGFITLSITDAPVDYATEVRVQFDGVEFMPVDSTEPPIRIMFDQPVSIDLLELQGSNSKTLLSDEILPTGNYDWVRLMITAANDGVMDSYIRLANGSVYELDMPADYAVGLQIVGGLEVIANTPSAKTIDFDLRKSVIMTTPGDYKIKPTLNLVSNNLTGTISGTIYVQDLVSSDCSDSDPSTGNAVYLFEGFNVQPDDIDGNDPEPVASSLVKLNTATGEYEYRFGFVPSGKYTAVMTCESDLDDQMTDDTINFSRANNINVTNNKHAITSPNAFR